MPGPVGSSGSIGCVGLPEVASLQRLFGRRQQFRHEGKAPIQRRELIGHQQPTHGHEDQPLGHFQLAEVVPDPLERLEKAL